MCLQDTQSEQREIPACTCVYGKKLANINCIKLEHSITQRVNSGIIYQYRAIISTHFVSSVSCANNLDERDGHCFEANELPWDATVVAFVDDLDPVALVVGDLYVVAVGTVIAVPEEEPGGGEGEREWDGTNNNIIQYNQLSRQSKPART